jgi:hypothetical protein
LTDLDIVANTADLAQHCCSHSFSMEVYIHNPPVPSLMLTQCYRTRTTTLTPNRYAHGPSYNGVPKHHSAQHRLSQHAQKLLSDRIRLSHPHIRTHFTSTVHRRRIETVLRRVRVQEHLQHTSNRSPSTSIHPPPTCHARIALRTPMIQMTRTTRTSRLRSSSSTLVMHHLHTRQ